MLLSHGDGAASVKKKMYPAEVLRDDFALPQIYVYNGTFEPRSVGYGLCTQPKLLYIFKLLC